MPPDGPEVSARRDLRKAFDTEWPAAQAVLGGSTSLEPIHIDISEKGADGKPLPRDNTEVLKEATTHLEREYLVPYKQGDVWFRVGTGSS